MKVTLEYVITDKCVTDSLWTIYDLAFEKLRISSPCRQYLKHDEFLDLMVDKRMLKFILLSETDQLLGLALIATDIKAIPWLSFDYFERRFSNEMANGKLFYVESFLTDPSNRKKTYSDVMLSELAKFFISREALVCYDCCSFNNRWMTKYLTRAVHKQEGCVDVTLLETQHYFAFDVKKKPF